MARQSGNRKSFGTKMSSKNADILSLDQMWDDNLQMPKPWVFAIVFAFHFALVFVLINSKTLNFKPQKPIPVEIIYEDPPPPKPEPEPEIKKPPEPILYKKPEVQIEKNIEVKPKPFKLKEAILKPEIQKIERNQKLDNMVIPPVPKPEEIKKEVAPDPKRKLLDIEKMMREMKTTIKGPDIATDTLGNSADKSKIAPPNPNTALLNEPKQKDLNLDLKNLEIDTKIAPNTNALNKSKLEQPKDYSKPAPVNAPINLDIKQNKIGDNSKLLDEKQNAALNKFNQDELLRQKQIEALEKQKQNGIPSNNAPIAPNGELSKPSGITSVSPGVLPSGGPPIANQAGGNPPASGGGALPKKPASYGKGSKNLFEEGEDNSAIGKVGRAIDCAKLGQKERSEKCPNWRPLEGGTKKDIAPKPPIGFNPNKTNNTNPMPTCPKDHPNGNLGVPCLPQKPGKTKF